VVDGEGQDDSWDVVDAVVRELGGVSFEVVAKA